jgi:hypothetical protein
MNALAIYFAATASSAAGNPEETDMDDMRLSRERRT